MIHYISPYRSDKNIGKAINDAILQLNADSEDWIVHLDQDAMWLRPDSKKQLEEILRVTKYDILGPMTNRLNSATQRSVGTFHETNILKHIETANLWHERMSGKVYPVTEPLAAFCLCFKVRVWKELGGFAENNLQFDYLFCSRALRSGKKLGLMAGIYVFHLYRMGKDVDNIDHLL